MKCDKYKEFLTKENMMGPNSMRVLDEMLSKIPEAISGGRVLDLGCGRAITSLFLARETSAKEIFATDLWISATENKVRIEEWGEEDKIIPIHADATNLPYANQFFDTIVSVDAFHYFGCNENVFADKIYPLLINGGYAVIAIPGIKQEFSSEIPEIMTEWAQEEAALFHSVDWWQEHIKQGIEDKIEVTLYESQMFDEIWEEWFQSGHEFAIRDKEFFDRGLKEHLNFIYIIVRRKNKVE